MTPEEIFNEFAKWSPGYAKLAKKYKPWGTTSIAVWFDHNCVYKVKKIADGRFNMQKLSQEDINKKLGLKT